MINRLATCDDADLRISEVIKALEKDKKEYIYWGNPIAFDCNYLFIHSKGDSTIKGILKVGGIKDREDILKEDFLIKRPKDWGEEMVFEKYFIIEKAKKVSITINELKNSDGNPKESNTMHDMSFINWDKFQPF